MDLHLKHNHNQDLFKPIIENIILVAILLVIVHTIVEDLAIVYSWPHQTVVILAFVGFFFDLLFTAEFIGRSTIVSKRGKGHFMHYIKYQRGWIDALSSVPLLLLVSGPTVVFFLIGDAQVAMGLSFLSILKTAKAIRVTRILRLIRIIKLFGKIQNTESAMTNRHIGTISTISVVTLIFVLILVQFLQFVNLGDHKTYLDTRMKDISLVLNTKAVTKKSNQAIVNYIKASPHQQDILVLYGPKNKVLYTHPNKDDLMWSSFNKGKPKKINKNYSVVLSYYMADAVHAKVNMIIFLAILSLIMAMMFFYSRLFAQQVTDIMFVMNKGFKDWDYNLQAKENPNFATDEVFQLAKTYNIKWLPLKNQIMNFRRKKKNQTEKSVIKMDDLF